MSKIPPSRPDSSCSSAARSNHFSSSFPSTLHLAKQPTACATHDSTSRQEQLSFCGPVANENVLCGKSKVPRITLQCVHSALTKASAVIGNVTFTSLNGFSNFAMKSSSVSDTSELSKFAESTMNVPFFMYSSVPSSSISRPT